MKRATATLILSCLLLLPLCSSAAAVRVRQRVQQRKKAAPKVPRPSQLVQCRTDFKTPTWDGKMVQICNPSICAGAEELPELGRPKSAAKAQRRRPLGSWRAFVQAVSKAEGWLVLDHIWIVKVLTDWQHDSGVLGSVGEIGVHHGKFWLPIVTFSYVFEPAVAVDLFAEQDKNFDGSGKGSQERFLGNARAELGLRKDQLTLFAGDSLALSGEAFRKAGLPRFRLLSVDGGHSLETTLHDMTLAACLLREGGIMVLDDVVMQPEGAERFPWAGVPAALFAWVLAQQRMAPFLWAHNKLYLATAGAHAGLLALVSNFPGVACAHALQELHASRYAIGGHAVCVNMKPPLEADDLLAAMFSEE
jgi:hypothetical protein